MIVYVDGKYVPEEEAVISVWDHGFLYGDGIFEGIRVYGGRVFGLDEHLKRFYNSAKAIAMRLPMPPEELGEIICETLRRNNIRDGYVRLVASRGKGKLGLDPSNCQRPCVVVIVDEDVVLPEARGYGEGAVKGIEAVTVSVRRNRHDMLSPRIKSVNYLNNILARLEAKAAGASEAIMLNDEGYVTECPGDNLFIVVDGVLVTAPLWAGILDGVTRRAVIRAATRAGIEVRECLYTQYDLYTADEAFATATRVEIVPIVKIDGRVIGTGEVGPVTRTVFEAFRALTRIEGTPVYR